MTLVILTEALVLTSLHTPVHTPGGTDVHDDRDEDDDDGFRDRRGQRCLWSENEVTPLAQAQLWSSMREKRLRRVVWSQTRPHPTSISRDAWRHIRCRGFQKKHRAKWREHRVNRACMKIATFYAKGSCINHA